MIHIVTDFGLGGPYLGEMRAVLWRQAPDVPHVDLMADLPPFRPKLAAYLLTGLARRFEPGDVALAVVDPGVGTERLPLALEIDGVWFVGPDNGLFELVIRRATKVACHRIAWQPDDLSTSFHGRDLFAPMAARLAMGDASGLEPCTPRRMADWPDDLAEIVYADRYGNLMTGLRASKLRVGTRIILGDRFVPIARVFADLPSGGLLVYANSLGLLELAANRTSAAAITGLRPGDAIKLELQGSG